MADPLLVDVSVIGDRLIIAVPLEILKTATIFMPALQAFDEAAQKFLEPEIKDIGTFAKEVVSALDREEEDGTTLVHRMLDKAILNAVEGGADGIVTGWDKIGAKKPRRSRRK